MSVKNPLVLNNNPPKAVWFYCPIDNLLDCNNCSFYKNCIDKPNIDIIKFKKRTLFLFDEYNV